MNGAIELNNPLVDRLAERMKINIGQDSIRRNLLQLVGEEQKKRVLETSQQNEYEQSTIEYKDHKLQPIEEDE